MQNIETFKSFMEHRGHGIQTLRTNQGSEYASREIKDFLKVNGIMHSPTGLAAHVQMHVYERMNQTVVEMTPSMLIYRDLTKMCWGYTILYATTIRNWCTESTFQNRETAYVRVFNKEPDIKIFYPFGCAAYEYLSLGKRSKLFVTAEKRILVGEAEGLLFHNVHFDSTKSIIHARDVTFIDEPDEQIFWSTIHNLIPCGSIQSKILHPTNAT